MFQTIIKNTENIFEKKLYCIQMCNTSLRINWKKIIFKFLNTIFIFKNINPFLKLFF